MRIQFTITDFTNHQSYSLIYPNNFVEDPVIMLQAKPSDHLYLSDFRLIQDKKTHFNLNLPDQGFEARDLAKHLKPIIEFVNNLTKPSLIKLFNSLSPEERRDTSLMAVEITEYQDDHDLDLAFKTQTPSQILCNQGDINYQDDYILTNLDTNRVDTCNKYQMHAYLEQALPDIYRILLNRK